MAGKKAKKTMSCGLDNLTPDEMFKEMFRILDEKNDDFNETANQMVRDLEKFLCDQGLDCHLMDANAILNLIDKSNLTNIFLV